MDRFVGILRRTDPAAGSRFPWAATAAIALVAGGAAARAQITDRVSVATGGEEANGRSGDWRRIAVSRDGSIVAFESDASNLVADDRNGATDVFVHDRSTRSTRRVTENPTGARFGASGGLLGISLSADGRYVAFDSSIGDVVNGDTNLYSDLFVHDRETSVTVRLNLGPLRVRVDGHSVRPFLSADGRFVVFESDATVLVTGDGNGRVDVFLHDRDADSDGVFDEPEAIETVRVSVSSSGAEASSHSHNPTISADGRFIGFDSDAPNLVPGDTNGHYDVFVHDRLTRVTTRVSVGTAGEEGSSYSYYHSLSTDGRYVAFCSLARNLVPGDANEAMDTFVRDRDADGNGIFDEPGGVLTERVSISSSGDEGRGGSFEGVLSADGRFVAFRSFADNLVPGDGNGTTDVFLRDRRTGTTRRINVSATEEEANGWTNAAVLSGDGRAVVFDSVASNLVSGDTNDFPDVFVREWMVADVRAVVPSVGSERGGDVVHLLGRGFTSLRDTTVRIGEAGAAIVAVLPERLIVRTPSGTGTSDVVLESGEDVVVVEAGYEYLAAEIAARFGNVNTGSGDRENVLFLNASAGDAERREVNVGIGEPIVLAMTAPSSRPAARFVLYAWPGVPDSGSVSPLPRGLGDTVFPSPPGAAGCVACLSPAPLAIWNNIGRRRALGAPSHPSWPAPSAIFSLRAGLPGGARVTFQGIIEDSRSPIREGFSVTNAVVLRVR